jgi:signal transduction histidine kinase
VSGVDPNPAVASAAICRAVLLGRAAVALTAAGAGLLLVPDRWRVITVLVLVVTTTLGEVMVLTRWPAVVRRPWLAIAVDLLIAAAVLILSSGGMAYFCYVAGSAALAGALLGMRALPLWAGQAALGFAAAAFVLRANRPPPEVTAFIAAFPMVSVLAGIGAAAATSALARYMELAVGAIAATQRSAAASERARLARELHDSVAKTLRGVSFAALALPSSLRRHPALAEQLAGTVSQGAEVAARETRQLVEGLRVDALDRDFDATIHTICRGWADTTGIGISVVADRVEPPVALRYELARILREALHNVERHARAGQVRVRLLRLKPGEADPHITVGEADQRGAVGGAGQSGVFGGAGQGGVFGGADRWGDFEVELTIRDDGVGFVFDDLGALQARGHYGIVGMSERARTVGGTLRVTSSVGTGTLVTVRAPLSGEPTP